MKRRQFLRGTLGMVACGFFARRGVAAEVEEEVQIQTIYWDSGRCSGGHSAVLEVMRRTFLNGELVQTDIVDIEPGENARNFARLVSRDFDIIYYEDPARG